MGTFNWSDGTSTKMSSETERALQAKFSPEPELAVGDIVEYKYGSWKSKRIVMYDAQGELRVYSVTRDGKMYLQTLHRSNYRSTGKNIFTDNLFNLTT